MSHFAKVSDGKVVQVIVAEPDYIETLPDKESWIQTSYNTYGNVHYGPDRNPDGGVALRGNYAAIDHVYDSEHDVFYLPQPYPSWTLDHNTWMWIPPIPRPPNGEDGKLFMWNEEKQIWE